MSDYIERPYRQLYPTQPTTRRHVVSSKDDTYIDGAAGTEIRVPVEDRTPQKVTRTTTFGVEVIDLDADDHTRQETNP